MSLLTDEEISLMAHNEDEGDWNNLHFRDCWHKGYMAGARAAEERLLAKLASAELPEPAFRGPESTGSYFDAFTADQLRQAYAQGAASQLTEKPSAWKYQERGREWLTDDLLEAKRENDEGTPIELFTRKEPK